MSRKKGSTIARKNISTKQFEAVLKWIDESGTIKQRTKLTYRQAFSLLYLGGFRVSELTFLDNSDIADIIEEGELHLSNKTKTKKPREVYFSLAGQERIEILFQTALAKEPLNAVALKAWGSCYERYNPAGLTRSLNEVLKKALGRQYSTHSFRAGYITDMAKSGENLKTIQENIGHVNMSTTLGYIYIDEEDKKKAVNKVR
jgi:site-specific recombinase XerD